MANPTQQDICAAISAARMPPGMTTRLIGIDGCGGAVKSTLATLLADRLGAQTIHTDDFASWDSALEWGDRFLVQVIQPLMKNEPVHYQRYDWHARTLADWKTVPTGGTVIIEGVSATRAVFRPALCCQIFVSAPRNIRLRRGLDRDGDAALPLWQGWMAEEDAYLAAENPREYADFVIDGTQPFPD